MTRKRRKPIVVEQHGVHIRLFQRGEYWWLDMQAGGQRSRRPAKTTDRRIAEAHAGALAAEIAKQLLFGVRPETLTLGQLFDGYHEHKGRHVTRGQWATAIATRQRLFRAAWGDGLAVASISQSSVDRYCAWRREAHLERQRARHANARDGQPEFSPRPLRDGALDPDFRWLSSVCNWAIHHKLADGRRLLTFNPLHDCTWPRERNLLQPVASKDRFAATIAQADTVDPTGRFRLALSLVRYTARRINAVVNLRASDLLRTPDQVRAALALVGRDEGAVGDYPHGGIYWRGETDKQGMERVTAISAEARVEIDRYVAAHPTIGDAPLFPADRARGDAGTPKPLSRHTAHKWLTAAERLAGLPKMRRGGFHMFRRLWATERKHLPDVSVASAGGWKTPKAMKASYQKSTSSDELAAVLAV